MECAQCGADLGADDKYCSVCGQPAPTPTPDQQQPAHENELPPISFQTSGAAIKKAPGTEEATSPPPAPQPPTVEDTVPISNDDPPNRRRLLPLILTGSLLAAAAIVFVAVAANNGSDTPLPTSTTLAAQPTATTAATTTTTDGNTTTTTTTLPPMSQLSLSSATVIASYERPEVPLQCTGVQTFYTADKLIDGDMNTGWGADSRHITGDGAGQWITIDLGRVVALSQIGLTPGFAKVGPRQDNDCRDAEAFPHNRFVQEVQYLFDDGSQLTQRFEQRKDLQSIDLVEAFGAPMVTRNVTITLVDVVSPPGVDDDTIISEARFWYFPDQG